MCQDPSHLFSLIQDPDQNKEDTSFISVVSYGVYIALSGPIQFCPLPYQNFEKTPKILQILQNPGDPRSECFFAHFHGVQIVSSKK